MTARATVRMLGGAMLLLAACVVALAMVVLVIGDHAHIIDRAMGGTDPKGDLKPVRDLVNEVKGPANATFGAIVPLGILAGGALMAFGNRKGMQLIATSGGAGAVVLLGNGFAL